MAIENHQPICLCAHNKLRMNALVVIAGVVHRGNII